MESTASCFLAGINAYLLINNKEPITLSNKTMLGAIANYITSTSEKFFQPMNANFGILPPLEQKERDDKKRKLMYSQRAVEELNNQILQNKEIFDNN